MKQASIAVVLALSGTALGQASFTDDSVITLNLSWTDNGAGNGNGDGILEPGETALISLHGSFSNQFTLAHFAPAIGGISAGETMGLASLIFNIRGGSAAAGTFNDSSPLANSHGTSGYGVRGGWRIAGSASNGIVQATGIDTIQIGQFSATPDTCNTANPVANLFRFLWTPWSYGPRDVPFSVVPCPIAGLQVGSLYLDLGNGTGVGVYLAPQDIRLPTLRIAVVPAPSAAATLTLIALTSARRRRTRSRS